ncbi:gamma-glutamylcyclotransferase [Bosea minatitlanensis]|uniref:Gamma-glutamylcyclotransferase n=1 Tax=Bosea minatitlanensis TaxID=128782 RepID=A0ABW0EZN4_9HYPH|nr:gamma-glutamylcyclotransferase [Bosea minatitlanensis]MCT4492745.1 gamma-glutamylcyclotransferase [Bosea minatitlanensis]
MTDVIDNRRARASHIWDRDEHEHYVESAWVGRRLFQVERFEGEVCDPCCGFGNMMEGARAAGLEICPFDIVDRGYEHQIGTRDFLASRGQFANFATNPPFDRIQEFTEHAVRLAERKVAVVFPTRRLNAAGAWLQLLPLARVYFLTPRPSMPPGHIYRETIAKGREPSGDTKDYAIAVFIKNFEGEPVMRWLHRDGGAA